MKTKRSHVVIKWILLIFFATVLLSGILAIVIGAVAKGRLADEYPAPGKLAHLGDRVIHYQLIGAGNITVVMEAGQNEFSLTWCRVAPEIARHARVFVYDRPGLGWSEPSPEPRTATVIIDELHRLLVAERIPGPYLLVGHSMGGLYMKAFAARYPENVRGVVFIDAAHELQWELFPEEQRRAITAYVDSLSKLLDSIAPPAVLGFMALDPGQIPADPRLTPPAVAQYRAVFSRGTVMLETMKREVNDQAESFRIIKDMRIVSLNVPVVVIRRGKRESMTSGVEVPAPVVDQTERVWLDLQERTAALSPRHRIITAGRSGHYIQLDEPQLVIDAVVDMVRSIGNTAQ
jgi:pimeloyl-ACP methyl ester carboxylesterase